MLHNLDDKICKQIKSLAMLGKANEAVDLICDWWNDQTPSPNRASHFGIFVRRHGNVFQSLTPDDPDERQVADLLASNSHVKIGSAFIEFRYDRVEEGVRYTYNMDGECVDCSTACLDTYRWWASKAVKAYAEFDEEDRTTISAC